MPSGESTVLFRALPQPRFSPQEKRALKTFAASLSSRIAAGRSFTCLLTDDRELQRLNQSFLGKDYATDVLSFPTECSDELGELAISVQRAEEQAAEFGHSRLREIQILMLHGLLHLSGMDHETDGGEMARAEEKWRIEFSLPPTLIERSLQLTR